MITVVSSGFYTSIQDAGRQRFRHLGVPVSGAMDQAAFLLANALLPYQKDQCVFECTMLGPTLAIEANVRFVITGAKVEATLDGNSIEINKVYTAHSGSILMLGKVTQGLRSYLRFEAMLDSPSYLGSKSYFYPITPQKTLVNGMIINIKSRPTTLHQSKVNLRVDRTYFEQTAIAVLPGPDWAKLSKKDQNTLLSEIHQVEAQDRMGYQLSTSLRVNAPRLFSQLVLPGMVQLTPAGKLLIATADCQVTGGYLQVLQLEQRALNILVQKAEGALLTFQSKLH